MHQQFPWQRREFDGWSIVGMNHYRLHSGRYLFVAMAKDGRCIKVEGPDTALLWADLAAMTLVGEQKARESE